MTIFVIGMILIAAAAGIILFAKRRAKAAASAAAEAAAADAAAIPSKAQVAMDAFAKSRGADLPTSHVELEYDRARSLGGVVLNRALFGAAAVLGALGTTMVVLQLGYTQGPGEASVIKSFTGQVVGFNDRSGLALKAPWDDTVRYDILNQQVIFSNPANVHGDTTAGGEITFTDKDGVAANEDVAVRISIRGDKVVDIYNHYGDEKAFESKLITQDVRAVAREVPNAFSTIDVLTKRSDVEAQILKGLQERWETEGVQVDSVALQDIRYPQAVTQKYADAQNARTQATQAQAELDASKISAQQQVVQAQAQADANKILSQSLTPEILRQRELDTLKEIGDKGNMVVTDGSSAPLLSIPGKK